jgi:hypothetical protein
VEFSVEVSVEFLEGSLIELARSVMMLVMVIQED